MGGLAAACKEVVKNPADKSKKIGKKRKKKRSQTSHHGDAAAVTHDNLPAAGEPSSTKKKKKTKKKNVGEVGGHVDDEEAVVDITALPTTGNLSSVECVSSVVPASKSATEKKKKSEEQPDEKMKLRSRKTPDPATAAATTPPSSTSSNNEKEGVFSDVKKVVSPSSNINGLFDDFVEADHTIDAILKSCEEDKKKSSKTRTNNPQGNNGLNGWKNAASIQLWENSSHLSSLDPKDKSPFRVTLTNEDGTQSADIVYVPPPGTGVINGKDIRVGCTGCQGLYLIGTLYRHTCTGIITTAGSKSWAKRGAAAIPIRNKAEPVLVELNIHGRRAEVLFLPPKSKGEARSPFEYGCLACYTINTPTTIGKHICPQEKECEKGEVAYKIKRIKLPHKKQI